MVFEWQEDAFGIGYVVSELLDLVFPLVELRFLSG